MLRNPLDANFLDFDAIQIHPSKQFNLITKKTCVHNECFTSYYFHLTFLINFTICVCVYQLFDNVTFKAITCFYHISSIDHCSTWHPISVLLTFFFLFSLIRPFNFIYGISYSVGIFKYKSHVTESRHSPDLF